MIGSEYLIKSIIREIVFSNKICESEQEFMAVNRIYNKLFEDHILDGEPLTIPELRNLLRTRIVNFEFIKLDGEVRPATGTTMLKYIPVSEHPKGVRPSSPRVATFFDMKKRLWRSVSEKSKEIVLKDTKGGKPVVVVSDKVPPKPSEIISFKEGVTYKYTNRYGITGHTVTVVHVGNKGYYLKLDKSGPLFYLTFDTANKRIGDEVSEHPLTKSEISPSENDAVNRVRQLINEPTGKTSRAKPIDTNDNNTEAYDVNDDSIVKPEEESSTEPTEIGLNDDIEK